MADSHFDFAKVLRRGGGTLTFAEQVTALELLDWLGRVAVQVGHAEAEEKISHYLAGIFSKGVVTEADGRGASTRFATVEDVVGSLKEKNVDGKG